MWLKMIEKKLPEWVAKVFRKKFRRLNCTCGKDISKELIRYYTPHEGGYEIPFEKEKCWLYVHCPKCEQDLAIWKLGVKR